MSTEPILSINRCFEEMYPSATKDVRCMINLSLDERTPEMLLPEQQVLKLHDRMPHRKKKIPRRWDSKIPTIVSAVNINEN